MGNRPAPTWRTPLALVRWRSLRRGVLGGSPLWTAVAVAVWVPRLLRRLTGAQPELLATERLRPGQSLRVSTQAARSRRSAPADR